MFYIILFFYPKYNSIASFPIFPKKETSCQVQNLAGGSSSRLLNLIIHPFFLLVNMEK